MGSGSRHRRNRRRRDRAPGRYRGAGGGVLGDPGRGRKGHRRPRHHQWRQCSARRRDQRPEEIRHRGFPGSAVPRSDRLVGGRAERFSRLSVQRPRNRSCLCRQQCGHLRMAARPWRRICRQGARRPRRQFGRELAASGNALCRHALADAAHRRTGRPGSLEDAILRQWVDARPRDYRQESRCRDSCSTG